MCIVSTRMASSSATTTSSSIPTGVNRRTRALVIMDMRIWSACLVSLLSATMPMYTVPTETVFPLSGLELRSCMGVESDGFLVSDYSVVDNSYGYILIHIRVFFLLT